MRRARRWAPSVLWGLGILTLTSLPAAALPVVPAIAGVDKLVHAAMYAVLAALITHAMSGHSLRTVLVLGGALALFAAADEWHQRWIPGRSADLLDWVADISGAAIGYAYSSRSARRRREIST